jgi:hypothetical protein
MFGNNALSAADIAAVTDGRNGNFGYGECWWIILLFALFGWGRGGMFGNNGGCGCDGAYATVGDVERGFNNQSTQQRFNGLDQGICQLGYDNLAQISNLQNTIMQGNFGIQEAINNAAIANMQDTNSISRQLADCCCENREAIQGVNYNMSQGFANQSFQLQQCCCDLKEAMNNNTRTITDQLTQFRMEDKDNRIAELQSQVQALNLAQSQANQNQYLLSRLQPNAIPAYQVANPYAAYNGCGCCGTQTCC